MWIFGYGSIIYRPAFEFVEKRRAFIKGWSRRFWQGSPDHRGVPGAPGRVVTLVPSEGDDPDAPCGGCAYRIDPARADAIVAELDVREQAGFDRRTVALYASPSEPPFAEALTWIADASNPHFLGPLPEPEIAAWIRERRGPSGSNAEYALRLAEALSALEIEDPHVETIARHLAFAR